MIRMEDLRHPLWIRALSRARRALTIRAAPAVTEPHANRVSVSHPVDMHAQAIIAAPMRNTKSEPIANLRSQGMVNSIFLVTRDQTQSRITIRRCVIDAIQRDGSRRKGLAGCAHCNE